tara:strand:+ start:9551 stop:9829 length:279 start_codon:yes stop_codon:yes gene_type:complete
MSFLNKNNPVWSSSTKTTLATVSGKVDTITGRDGSVTVSNQGPVNLYVGTTSHITTGILLQPGAALTIAMQPGVTIYLNDDTSTAIYTLVEY